MDKYKIEHNFATQNFDRVIESIPKPLVKKEDNLLKFFMKNKRNSSNKLKLLYDFMDNIYQYVNKNTPCKKSCNHCCYYNISVSELEIQYIESSNNIKRNQSHSIVSDFHGTPCPFLKEGCCSIYNSRPFVCRRHVSLGSSDNWCKVEVANKHEFPLLSFSEIDKSYDFLVNESGLNQRSDIRQLFKL
ncbi:MAG: YkgJ family cysteine cluster protein [Methylobacter sp.]